MDDNLVVQWVFEWDAMQAVCSVVMMAEMTVDCLGLWTAYMKGYHLAETLVGQLAATKDWRWVVELVALMVDELAAVMAGVKAVHGAVSTVDERVGSMAELLVAVWDILRVGRMVEWKAARTVGALVEMTVAQLEEKLGDWRVVQWELMRAALTDTLWVAHLDTWLGAPMVAKMGALWAVWSVAM